MCIRKHLKPPWLVRFGGAKVGLPCAHTTTTFAQLGLHVIILDFNPKLSLFFLTYIHIEYTSQSLSEKHRKLLFKFNLAYGSPASHHRRSSLGHLPSESGSSSTLVTRYWHRRPPLAVFTSSRDSWALDPYFNAASPVCLKRMAHALAHFQSLPSFHLG